ncbi:MAG: KEOPS complex kinase/ATPase Bud32 [Candidatus Pacearchaeota archaeon]|jgi:TP53 regulating kinase-like protein
MKSKILFQGAEAIISLKDNKIIKNRTKKAYRLPELDIKLRKKRTKSESKIMNKLYSLINVPKILETKENEIIMEYIQGEKLSDTLDNLKNKYEIAFQIGQETAKIHDSDIIHGDLTTSNMIYVEDKTNKNNFKVYFIDFGLGFHSAKIEDKAVDLHLIKQALEAKHYKNHEELFKSIIKGYNSKDKDKILKQLEKVESRGRYKDKH